MVDVCVNQFAVVHAVQMVAGEDEVVVGDGHRRFRALVSQGKKACALAAAQDQCKHFVVHGHRMYAKRTPSCNGNVNGSATILRLEPWLTEFASGRGQRGVQTDSA